MFGGRQTIAVWGSFVLGCTLASLGGRAREPVAREPEPRQSVSGLHVSIESAPFTDPTDLERRVIATATRWGLDPALVLAVIEAESGQSPGAVSPKGAVGLMQVLPETAALMGLPDPANPTTNLDAGCGYLANLIESFGGDIELALAAYNAGPGAVRRWGGVPPFRETRAFVTRVAAAYQRLTGLDLPGAQRFTSEPSILF